MNLLEGEIYEGEMSLMGEEGPLRRWLVVAPFGKLHIHSIDDPLELHCWPATTIELGLESGRVRLVGFEPDHPVIRLQRLKEENGIRDAELGLLNGNLAKMLALLQQLRDQNDELTPYAAGELYALLPRTPMSEAQLDSIKSQVAGVLRGIGAAGGIAARSDQQP
jgi:hypothetical protein